MLGCRCVGRGRCGGFPGRRCGVFLGCGQGTLIPSYCGLLDGGVHGGGCSGLPGTCARLGGLGDGGGGRGGRDAAAALELTGGWSG